VASAAAGPAAPSAGASSFDGVGLPPAALLRSDEAALLPGGSAAARFAPSTQRGGRRRARHLAAGAAALALVLSLAALFLAATTRRPAPSAAAGSAAPAPAPYTVFFLDDGGAGAAAATTTRLAAGSCTSYDLRPQPIWTRGVIPFDPHAWIWLGDMSYLDDAPIDCGAALAEGAIEAAKRAGCVCESDWLRRPGGCFAANPAHAARRAAHQLANAEYQAFVAHMCPAAAAADAAPQPPHFPPPPAACAKPILGVYDDHDYGANNGDARNPAKAQIKELYLDMVGEPRDSARRGGSDGAQAEYRFNLRRRGGGGGGGREGGGEGEEAIQLLLTDGRWFREPMPCSRREAWCRAVLAGFAPAGEGEEEGGGGSAANATAAAAGRAAARTTSGPRGARARPLAAARARRKRTGAPCATRPTPRLEWPRPC